MVRDSQIVRKQFENYFIQTYNLYKFVASTKNNISKSQKYISEILFLYMGEIDKNKSSFNEYP